VTVKCPWHRLLGIPLWRDHDWKVVSHTQFNEFDPYDLIEYRMVCAHCGTQESWIAPKYKMAIYGQYEGPPLPVDPKTCNHEEINWSPINFRFQANRTAEIWQEGDCVGCKALIQTTYNQGVLVVARTGELVCQ
jgi:hypothetical protein